MLAHLGSKRPPTPRVVLCAGLCMSAGVGGFAHFVCALCVRILTVGGVGGWVGVGCPEGGWGHSKH